MPRLRVESTSSAAVPPCHRLSAKDSREASRVARGHRVSSKGASPATPSRRSAIEV